MKTHSWKYTQYSQFNESDTLLLVSGVHFGTPHSTSGEIAVFSVEEGFQLQCRVMNKPYDIFGTWYSDRYLLSGELHWLAHLVSSSLLTLNKASQESASEHVPITSQLYRFYNKNASSIRAIMVANCLSDTIGYEMAPASSEPMEEDSEVVERGNPPSHRDMNQTVTDRAAGLSPIRIDPLLRCRPQDTLDYARPFGYNCDYRKVENANRNTSTSLDSDSDGSLTESAESSVAADDYEECDDVRVDKYLIFTTGSKTFTPHQIGFKRMKPVSFPKRLDPGPSLKERLILRQRAKEMQNQLPEPNWLNFESVADKFDKVKSYYIFIT